MYLAILENFVYSFGNHTVNYFYTAKALVETLFNMKTFPAYNVWVFMGLLSLVSLGLLAQNMALVPFKNLYYSVLEAVVAGENHTAEIIESLEKSRDNLILSIQSLKKKNNILAKKQVENEDDLSEVHEQYVSLQKEFNTLTNSYNRDVKFIKILESRCPELVRTIYEIGINRKIRNMLASLNKRLVNINSETQVSTSRSVSESKKSDLDQEDSE